MDGVEDWDGTPIAIEDLSYRPGVGAVATGSIPIDVADRDGYATYFTSIPDGMSPNVQTLTLEQLKAAVDKWNAEKCDRDRGKVIGMMNLKGVARASHDAGELEAVIAIRAILEKEGPEPVLPGPITLNAACNLSRYRMHRRTPEQSDAWKAAVNEVIDGLKAATPLPDVKPEPIHFPDAVINADLIVGPVIDPPAEPIIVEAKPQ